MEWSCHCKSVRRNPTLDLRPANRFGDRKAWPHPRGPSADRCRATSVAQVVQKDPPIAFSLGGRCVQAGILVGERHDQSACQGVGLIMRHCLFKRCHQ